MKPIASGMPYISKSIPVRFSTALSGRPLSPPPTILIRMIHIGMESQLSSTHGLVAPVNHMDSGTSQAMIKNAMY